MEGKSLVEYIKEQHPIPEDNIREIMICLIRDLNEIHANKISHRNIKLETLMFKNIGYDLKSICFTGFNKSRTSDINNLMQSKVGDNQYASPQIINGEDEEYSVKTDIWSMGVVLFYLYVLALC